MALNTSLNPLYEEIGKGFVQQYYALFDDPDQRHNIIHFFNVRLQSNWWWYFNKFSDFVDALLRQ